MQTRLRSCAAWVPLTRKSQISPARMCAINRWKVDHPDFCRAIKDGKLISDMDVAERLHQRALGFEYEEAQAHKLKTVEYKEGKRVKEPERPEPIMVKRVVPPETTACIFWLKNRRNAE